MMKEMNFVTNGSLYNEALTRSRVNIILTTCIAEEKRLALADQQFELVQSASSIRPTTSTVESAPLLLQFETKLSFKVTYKKEQRLLQGIADYSLWYDTDEPLAINLIIVEAKREGSIRQAESQVTAYMGEQFTITGIIKFLMLIIVRNGTPSKRGTAENKQDYLRCHHGWERVSVLAH